MNKTSRVVCLILFTSAVCLHFFFILNYTYPFFNSSKRINGISQAYSYPFFHQTWSLFVPVPKNDQRLYVRVKQNLFWGSWQDVMQQETIKHQQTKISGNEMIILLLYNHLKNFNYKQPYNRLLIENKIFFYTINRYIKQHYKLSTNTSYELLLTNLQNGHSYPIYIKNQFIY